jgi:hypothetical protein
LKEKVEENKRKSIKWYSSKLIPPTQISPLHENPHPSPPSPTLSYSLSLNTKATRLVLGIKQHTKVFTVVGGGWEVELLQ